MPRRGRASVPASISRRSVRAHSTATAAPEALSLAEGCGWQRCATISASSSVSPGMRAETTSS